MRIAALSFAAAFSLMTLPPPARAQEPAGPPMLDSSAFENLGLTDDQRSKIQAIHEQVQEQNAPLRDQANKLMGGKTFRDLTPAERDSLRPKLQPLREQMMENLRKAREQIAQILTPEQRRKFAQGMHARRAADRGERHDST